MTNVGLQPGHFDASKMEAIELPFTLEEYDARLQRLLGMAREQGLDLLWITSPEGVAWTHGFFASWYKGQGPMRYPQCYGTAVHVESGRFYPFRQPHRGAGAGPHVGLSGTTATRPTGRPSPTSGSSWTSLPAEGWLGGTVGMEFWSYVPNRAISTMFEGAFLMHGCRPVDMSEMVRTARRQKSPQEIAYTEQAMACCDIGHQAIMEHLRPGITELDLFGKVMAAMMEAGGEFSALIPIFNTSPMDGEIPMSNGHTMASRKVIQAGEILCADLCGVFNRYHANALRGYFVGDNPPAKPGRAIQEVGRQLRGHHLGGESRHDRRRSHPPAARLLRRGRHLDRNRRLGCGL